MYTSRNIICIALMICSATFSKCAQQRPNSKIQIIPLSYRIPSTESNISSGSDESISSDTNKHELGVQSPYPVDVQVNLNDSNIHIEDNLEDTLFSTPGVNYNVTELTINKVTTEATTSTPQNTSTMVSQGIYGLGQQIIFQLLKNHDKREVKSEVISPLSIAGVVYLLYLGSAGRTEKELATLLGLNRGSVTNQKEIHIQFSQLLDQIINDQEINNDDKAYPEYVQNRVHNISVANAIFTNSNFTLRPQYVNVVENTYKSEVKSMDFARYGMKAKEYIDNWVNNRTHGKIPTILEGPPTGETEIIVVSALYFKALWWEELGVQMVLKQPFFPNGADREPIMVDTIAFASELLPYYESTELNCRILGFRYQKQISTMYIVQPLVSNRQALKDFQMNLTAEKLEALIENMKYAHFTILMFPKFHLQSQTDLKHIFRQLSVESLFSGANLTPITPSQNESNIQTNGTDDLDYLESVRHYSQSSPRLSISQIHHKVDLVVNERGTEGGAATAALVDKISARHLKIDTPFLFVIRQDSTKLPLFYGTVFEPEQD